MAYEISGNQKGVPVGSTLWQGKDAEGRRIWTVTANWKDGTPAEPADAVTHTRKAAVENARDDADAAGGDNQPGGGPWANFEVIL